MSTRIKPRDMEAFLESYRLGAKPDIMLEAIRPHPIRAKLAELNARKTSRVTWPEWNRLQLIEGRR